MAGPQLRAVHPPTALRRTGCGSDRSKVGAGIWLAHANREVTLAARHRAQEQPPLGVVAVAQ